MATSEKRSVAVTSATPSVQDVIDSYVYLLGRLLVLRQEHLELKDPRFGWNTVVHSEEGGFTWAANRDLAYSEAWVAVDEHTCTVIEIPDFVGRYYSVQILNPWGETIANINERNYPNHPSGPFLLCWKHARVTLPKDSPTERIYLPGRKARVLIHVEHGADKSQAAALQRRIRVRPTGRTVVPAPVEIPMFTNDALPNVEAFDAAVAVLESEPDINPGTDALQERVRAIAGVVASSPVERRRVDTIIREHARAALKKHVAAMNVFGNGWVRPKVAGNYGNEWAMRTVANLNGIWANNHTEVVYFGNGTALPLSGDDTYTLRFPKTDLPVSHVKYFWSVSCVDAVTSGLIPNPMNRSLLNHHSKLQYGADGSLTLYFSPSKPDNTPEDNWLPTSAGRNYLLTWRSYGPDQMTLSGHWFPPPLQKCRRTS